MLYRCFGFQPYWAFKRNAFVYTINFPVASKYLSLGCGREFLFGKTVQRAGLWAEVDVCFLPFLVQNFACELQLLITFN